MLCETWCGLCHQYIEYVSSCQISLKCVEHTMTTTKLYPEHTFVLIQWVSYEISHITIQDEAEKNYFF